MYHIVEMNIGNGRDIEQKQNKYCNKNNKLNDNNNDEDDEITILSH